MSGGSIGSIAGGIAGSFVGQPALGASIGGALGGAISGPSGGSPATTTVGSSLPAWLATPYQQQVQQAATLAAKPYNPAFNYQVAGFNPTEQQAFNLTQNIVGQANPYYQQGLNLTGQFASQGLNGLNQSAFNSYMNPYIQNVLNTSTQQQFHNYNLAQQGINEQAANSGAFGNDRLGIAQGELANNFQKQLAAQQAATLSGGYNTALGGYQTGMAQGIGAANQLGNLAGAEQQTGIAGINALLGSGQLQQQLSQQQLTSAQQNALQQAQYPWTQLQNYQGIMAAPASQFGIRTQQATPYTAPGWQQGLGMASQMYGSGMMGNLGTQYGLPATGNFSGSHSSFASNMGPTIPSNYSSTGGIMNTLGNYASDSWNRLTSLFADGGVVPAYASGGLVDPRTLVQGKREGGILSREGIKTVRGLPANPEKNVNIDAAPKGSNTFGKGVKGWLVGGEIPRGIGGYDNGGQVNPMTAQYMMPGNLYDIGNMIAEQRANNFMQEQMSGGGMAPAAGYKSGGIVGYANGGGIADYIVNNYPGVANAIDTAGNFIGQHGLYAAPYSQSWAGQHPIESTAIGATLPLDAVAGLLGKGVEVATPEVGTVGKGVSKAAALAMKAPLAAALGGSAIANALEDRGNAATAQTAAIPVAKPVAKQVAPQVTPEDEAYADSVAQMAQGQQPQQQQGLTPETMWSNLRGPTGGQVSIPALAFGSALLAHGGGLENQALGMAGQSMLNTMLQQKQIETNAMYRDAMARMYGMRGMYDMGRLGLQQQEQPYMNAYREAEAAYMSQNPMLRMQSVVTSRANQLMSDPNFIGNPMKAHAEAMREFRLGMLGTPQMGLPTVQAQVPMGGMSYQGGLPIAQSNSMVITPEQARAALALQQQKK